MKTQAFTSLLAWLAGLAAIMAARPAHAETITWTNTSGGNWNVATNWSPSQVPGPNDDAIITNNGTYTVTVNVDATLANLTLGGLDGTQTLVIPSARFTLRTNGAVGAHGVLDLTGGTLSGAGTVTVSNMLNWTAGQMEGGGRTLIAPGATLNVSNASSLRLSARTLENAGTVLWTGTGDMDCQNGTVLTNRGLWEVLNNQRFAHWEGAGGRFDNAGLFRKRVGNGTTTFAGSLPLNNYGTVEVQSGTLLCHSPFNHTGTASVSGAVCCGWAAAGRPAGCLRWLRAGWWTGRTAIR